VSNRLLEGLRQQRKLVSLSTQKQKLWTCCCC